MDEFRKRYWKIISLFIIVILILGYLWNQGSFMSVKGKVIMSSTTEKGENIIYSMGSTFFGNSRNLYLATPEYDNIDYFEFCDGSILFSGRKKESGNFSLLEYKDGKIKELMTASKPIKWSVWSRKDQEVLCVISEDDEKKMGYLYRYDVKEKTFIKVLNEMVPSNQKPLVISTGEIIFVTEKRKPLEIINTIHILHNDSQIEDLIKNGKNLCWYEEDKKFLFVSRAGGSICEYDIETQDTRILYKDAYVASNLEVSPDKRYVVFIKESLSWIGTEVDTLYVLNIENSKTKVLDNLRNFGQYRGTVGWVQ